MVKLPPYVHSNKQLHSPPWGVSHATDRLHIPVFVIAPVLCERKQAQRTVQRVLDLFQKGPQMERPLVACLSGKAAVATTAAMHAEQKQRRCFLPQSRLPRGYVCAIRSKLHA